MRGLSGMLVVGGCTRPVQRAEVDAMDGEVLVGGGGGGNG